MSCSDILFLISIGILIGSIILCFRKHKELPKESDSISPIYFLMGGVFCSAFLLFLPLYYHMYANSPNTCFHSVISSIHHAIQLFTVDADRDIIKECYEIVGSHIAKCHAFLLSFEYIIAPSLSASFILLFIKKSSPAIKYAMQRPTETHIFSELNEKSITLAESILNNRKKKKISIVFTDVFENNEETSFEQLKRAKGLGAICFKKDLLAFNPERRRKLDKIIFYVMGEDETENINHAIALSKKSYKNVEECKIYVFTTRDECEYLINQRDEKEPAKEDEERHPKIRRINEISSLIYHYLDEQGYDKLYRSTQALSPLTDGKKTWKAINAVIIGVGLHGTEMIKALSWFCQMEGYRLRIDAFDKDPLAEKRFFASCPGLMINHNTDWSSDDAICEINIHAGIDVTTNDFFKEIMSLGETTYVLISLGSDIMNIRTAIKVRTCFAQASVTTREQVKEKIKISNKEEDKRPTCKQKKEPEPEIEEQVVPIIQAIVYKTYESQNFTKLINYRAENYWIEFIGGITSTYKEEVIINSDLENRSKKIHKLYYEVDTFDEYEYYYRSSCAAAIHIKAIAQELAEHKYINKPLDKGLLLEIDMFLKVINLFAFKAGSNDCKCSKPQECPGQALFKWAKEVYKEIIYPITEKLDAFSWESWSKGELLPQERVDAINGKWSTNTEILGAYIKPLEDWNFLAYEYSGIKESFEAIKANKGEKEEFKGINQQILRNCVLNLMDYAKNNQSRLKRVLYYILLEEKLKEQEHRRWNAYMRSEGFIYNAKRFDLGKMHSDIRPYSELPSSEKNKDIHMDMICSQLKELLEENVSA